MKFSDYNRSAWDKQVDQRNKWTLPVDNKIIMNAKRGEWKVVLTPQKPVPKEWFPKLSGCRTLCLASAGGQQAPVLAAAGAEVTVFDNSPKQLNQDKLVAERENLKLELELGDMRDLSKFDDESFDLIFHPVSNCFIDDVNLVWKECFRVLRSGGVLMSGFVNPIRYIFDQFKIEEGELELRHSIPYTDLNDLSVKEKQMLEEKGLPFEFGHTLEDQIGGQLKAGFVITDFYEDIFDPAEDKLSEYLPTFAASRSVKP